MAIDAMRNAYARDEIRAVIEAQEMAKRDEISRISFAERKGRTVCYHLRHIPIMISSLSWY